MKLEPLYTVHVDLKAPVAVGPGPIGTRVVYDVAGGTFEGPRMRGTIFPSGADWLLVGGDGVSRLNVRAIAATDDGAFIFLDYQGILAATPEAGAKIARGEVIDYGETYFMTAPRFETGV